MNELNGKGVPSKESPEDPSLLEHKMGLMEVELQHTVKKDYLERAIGDMKEGIAEAIGKMETNMAKSVGEFKTEIAHTRTWFLLILGTVVLSLIGVAIQLFRTFPNSGGAG